MSQFVFAQEESIATTYSEDVKNIIFDGKWSFTREWKESSLDAWKLNDGSQLVLRTSHDGNFIYVLIDYLSDVSADKGEDRATICLGKLNQNLIASENDYCFIVTLGDNSPVILQGGSPIAIYGNFKKISDERFIGFGSMSDKGDRYIAIPHTSYEFKIPVELVGRYNEYGFYLSVYDFHRNTIQSWPRDITLENNFSIPPPNSWGMFYSPDKSLPEFSMPLFLMILVFSVMIVIIRYTKFYTLIK